MGRVRLRGLVRLATAVRDELLRPQTAARRAHIKDTVRRGVQEADALLRRAGGSPDELPGPSRRAYLYLAGLDLDTPAAPAAPAAQRADRSAGPVRKVRLAGLKRDMGTLLDALDRARTQEQRRRACELVARSHAAVRRAVDGLAQGEQLTDQSAVAAAWMAYFAVPERAQAYLGALDRARPIFEQAFARRFGEPCPVHLHFCPLRGIFRWRRQAAAVRLRLPTPMICFDDDLLGELAAAATERGGDQRRVHEAMVDEAYQAIQAELEPDAPARSRGVVHDLQASFERVNERYFSGRMERPRLTWSRTLTRRKFGHYNLLRDIVMLSATLDQAGVAEFVVDYVMFHELLHKRHGVYWIGQRRYVHTPEFYADERRFERQADAEAELSRLARQG